MVKSDNGNVDFSNWGGLNEIVRYPEIAANHSPSEYALVELVVLFIKIPKPVNTERIPGCLLITNRNYRQRVSSRYTSECQKVDGLLLYGG
jgi:hypothetical protein